MAAPNLDAMTIDELWRFWKCTQDGRRRRIARQMFPTRPSGFSVAFQELGHYASNKATAMKEREEGRIARAIEYERICERIYSRLPAYAKW